MWHGHPAITTSAFFLRTLVLRELQYPIFAFVLSMPRPLEFSHDTPYFLNSASMLSNMTSAVPLWRLLGRFISKNLVITLPKLTSKILTVIGSIFYMQVSLLTWTIILNGHSTWINCFCKKLPMQLTMTVVLVWPHEKFSAAEFPLNSVFTYCVMCSVRLKKVLWCTNIATILTSALIEGCKGKIFLYCLKKVNVGPD